MWKYSDNLAGRRIDPAVLIEVCSFVFGERFNQEATRHLNKARREYAAKLKKQQKGEANHDDVLG